MAGGERTVKVKFTGDPKGLNDAANDSADTMEKWGKRLDKASLVALAGFTALGVGLVHIAGQFDDAFDTIQTQTGAMGAQLDGLKNDFNSALKGSVGDTQQTADALAGLSARLNLTGQPLVDLTKQLVNLSHLTGADIPASVDSITRVFGDWSIATGKQSQALDELFRASQATGTGINEIATLVVQFGAPLRQLGFNFEQSITLLGKWQKEGVNTELVLGGLKKALGNFSKAGEDPVKALQAFIAEIQTAGSTAKANQIAIAELGVKAGPDFAAAVREGRFSYQELLDTVTNGQSTINQTTSDTADWQESLQMLKNDALLAVNDQATALFNFLDETAIPVLQSLFDWTQQNQGATSIILGTIIALGAAVLIGNVAWRAYYGILAITTAATKTATAAQWLWNLALDANPVGLLIIGIGLLVAGLIILALNVESIGKAFLWLGDKIFDFFGNIIGTVKSWVGSFTSVWDGIERIVTAPFKAAFNYIAFLWNNTIGRIGFTVPDWVPVVGGKNFQVPKIEMARFAGGGVAEAGRPYIVGERGPEVRFDGTPGRIVSNRQAREALGSGNDTYVVVQIGDRELRELVRAERVEADRETRQWVMATSGVAA